MDMTPTRFKEYLKQNPDYQIHKQDDGEHYYYVGNKVFKYIKGYRYIKPVVVQIAGDGTTSYKPNQTSSSSYGDDIHQALLRDEKRNKNDQ